MLRRNRPLLLALVVSLTLLALIPVWQSQAAEHLKFTVRAGETVVRTIGDHQVQVEATDDVVVYLTLDNGTLASALEPGRRAESDPYVTVILKGPPDKVMFRGVVADLILQSFIIHETGHTEG
jgi:hypothetical protein